MGEFEPIPHEVVDELVEIAVEETLEGGVHEDVPYRERRNRPPDGVGRMGRGEDGRLFGSQKAWGLHLGFASEKPVVLYIQTQGSKPWRTAMYLGREIPLYHQEDLQPLIDRVASEDSLPGTEPTGLDHDGDEQRYGTLTAWARVLDWSSPTALRRLIAQLEIPVYRVIAWRGTKVPLYHEQDLGEVMRRREAVSVIDEIMALDPLSLNRYRGGLHYDAGLDAYLGSTGYWRQSLKRERTAIENRLADIEAISYPAPEYSDAPGRLLWSTHAVLAAFANRRHLLRAHEEPIPDIVSGRVVGTPRAWAMFLGFSGKRIHTLIRTQNVSPTRSIRTDETTINLYTDEQIHGLFSNEGQRIDPFKQPVHRSRDAAGAFLPYTQDFFVPVRGEYRQEYAKAALRAMPIVDRTNNATVYFALEAVQEYEQSREHPRTTVLRVPAEPSYLQYVAEVNLHAEAGQAIPALIQIAQRSLSLSEQGLVTINGHLVAPRSVLIERALMLEGKECEEALGKIAMQAPFAFRYVKWSKHWRGVAGLWLYHLDPDVRVTPSPGTSAWQHIRARERYLEIEEREWFERIEWQHEQEVIREQQKTDRERIALARWQREEAEKAQLREQIRQLQHQEAEVRRQYLEHLRNDVERLKRQPLTIDEKKLIIDRKGFVECGRHVLGTRDAWLHRYEREYPELTIPLLDTMIDRKLIACYQSTQRHILILERDIKALLLAIHEHRSQKWSR